jgi:hypothetical protein
VSGSKRELAAIVNCLDVAQRGEWLRRFGLVAVLGGVFLTLLGTVMAAAAIAAPAWQGTSSAPDRVAPGGTLKYLFTAKNVGDATTGGTAGVDVTLPAGTIGVAVSNSFGGGLSTWICSDPVGATTVHCDLGSPLDPGGVAETLAVQVSVAPGATGSLTATFGLSGGGAGSITVASTAGVGALPNFGITAFDGSVTDQAGNPYTQAGGHPYLATTTFGLRSASDSLANVIPDGGQVKTAQVDLPAGFVGNPTVASTCSMGVFLSIEATNPCPESSQVGFAQLRISFGASQLLPAGPAGNGRIPLYNLEAPPGVAASLGFVAQGVPIFLDARVSSKGDYHVQVSVQDAAEALSVLESSITLWGVPADPSHTFERACQGQSNPGCAAEAPLRAFVTNPTFCPPAGEGLRTDLAVDSWANPGAFQHTSFVSHDPPGHAFNAPIVPDRGSPQGPTGCDQVPFDPSISVKPESTLPDAPTGLSFALNLPQDGLDNPSGIATAHLKRAEVVLPEGMTISPSAASGLDACTDEQIGIGTDSPVACPEASKVGTVTATTPLLDEPLTGAVYVGSQESDDPSSGRMFRIFIALENERRGILVKLGGQVRTIGDEQTGAGRVETVFDNNPQVPVSNITLTLKGGSRAPLATPPSCGPKTVTAKLTSWAGQTVERSDTFTIDCPADLGGFAPSFSAGSVSPTGGAFSPLVVRINRPDRQQYIAGVSLEMPPGTLAKLKGVPLCGDAAAATGACPIASRIGTATVGAGPGSAPFFVTGPVALTGPYKGAPYGLAVAVRAKAGPFDLGTVVVRQAIYVDPVDARLRVVSDPLPVVLKGVPVRLRSVNVDVDRPGFTITPTSCAPKTIAANFVSSLGASSRQTVLYQASDCDRLGFSPKLELRLTGRGQTTDGKHPGLKATLTQPRHQAGIRSAKVALPLSLALDPENAASDTLCEFEEGQKAEPHCPASSIVGHAKATTPVLNKPLSGPVYFVKNIRIDARTGRRIRTLPTLLLALRGEVALNVRATSSVEQNKLVSTFATVPDAPVSRFDLSLKGGSRGILVVNGNACKRSKAATVALSAQNGKKRVTVVPASPPCAKARR